MRAMALLLGLAIGAMVADSVTPPPPSPPRRPFSAAEFEHCVCVAVDLPDVEGMDRGTANEWLRQRRAEFMAQ